MQGASKKRLAIGLLTLWIGATTFAFWWLQARLIKPFTEEYSAYADLAAIAVSTGQSDSRPIQVVELIDEDCYCSRVNRDHRERVRQRYANSQVAFVEVRPGEKLPSTAAAQLPDSIDRTSAPSALVLNQQGRLEYFGPYSFGAGCFTGNGTHVERAIDRALARQSRPQINVIGNGCFCDWKIST